MLTVKDVLKRVLEEWTEDKYCNNAFAKDAEGKATYPISEEACRWCVLRYIHYVVGPEDTYEKCHLRRQVTGVINRVTLKHCGPIALNDNLDYQRAYAVVQMAYASLYQGDTA